MDVRFLMIKSVFIISLVFLQIPPLECSVGLKAGQKSQADRKSILHPAPLTAGSETITSTQSGDKEKGTDKYLLHGEFGGFKRRQKTERCHVRHFEQFNLDIQLFFCS